MISVKTEIFKAFVSDEKLRLLVGERISAGKKPDGVAFPTIAFFEVANVDRIYADDNSIASEIVIQVDVWHTESTTRLAKEVDRVMKVLSFQRTTAMDILEDEEDVFHKVMRYVTTRFERGEVDS